jgi:hypothetical protein
LKLCYQNRIYANSRLKGTNFTLVKIKLPDESVHEIEMLPKAKVITLIEKIAEILCLTSFLDFRLCLKIKKTIISLHFDDTIENILKSKPKEEAYFYFFKHIFLKP